MCRCSDARKDFTKDLIAVISRVPLSADWTCASSVAELARPCVAPAKLAQTAAEHKRRKEGRQKHSAFRPDPGRARHGSRVPPDLERIAVAPRSVPCACRVGRFRRTGCVRPTRSWDGSAALGEGGEEPGSCLRAPSPQPTRRLRSVARTQRRGGVRLADPKADGPGSGAAPPRLHRFPGSSDRRRGKPALEARRRGWSERHCHRPLPPHRCCASTSASTLTASVRASRAEGTRPIGPFIQARRSGGTPSAASSASRVSRARRLPCAPI